MLKRLADYTTDKLKRAFQFFPLGWLGGAKASGSPQSQAVFKEKMKQTLASQGQHIRFLPYADRYGEETDAIRKAYPVMLRDPYIKQALFTKVFGVASLDLQVHAASKSTRDKEVADFVKHCLQRCRGGTRRAIMNIAIPGAIFGYSVTEKVLRKPNGRGQFGQKITLDMLKSKDVNKLQLEGDQYGNITGVRDNRDHQFYHKSNFLIYTHTPLFESPTGTSDFRAAYRAYWLADTAWQLRAIGLERYGLPVLKATYAGPEQQYALEQSLPNVRSQGYITVPQGALVEAMDIAGRGTTDFESAIRDLREEMVLAIAGAILQMLTTTGTAEMRGSADVQKGTFELLQWHLAQEAADVFNDQLFPDLVDLNYRGAEYPTCTFGGVSDGAMKDSITVDQFFLSSGLPLSKEELYEKYGRQQPLSEEDSVKGQQPQQPPMGDPGGGMPGMGQFSDDGEPIADVGSISRQLMAVQKTYASGSIPRSAAIANARIIKPDLDGESAAALFPMRQALPDGSAKFDESFAEKWITIGGKGGDDGKKKNGGKRVIIDAKTGEIKGGAVLKKRQGKKVGEAGAHVKPERKEFPRAEENPALPKKPVRTLHGTPAEQEPKVRVAPAQFDDDMPPAESGPSIYWPDIRQNASWDCGPAEIVAAGRYAGVAMPPVDYVARECGTGEVTGTTPGKIVRTLGAYGIDNTPKTRMGLAGLRSHVEAGTPVIVHVTQWNGEDHYIAIIGMNGGMVAYHDPSTGFGEIAEREFAKHWDGHDRFGLRYPQWGVAIHGRRGDGPTTAKFDDDNPGNIVAPGPHQDTDNAIRLSQAAQKHGVDVVAKITEEALMRLARLRMPLQAASLYTPEERQQLADALASTLSTADLLGRARTRIRAEQVARSGGMFKFSEPTSFQRFDDDRKPDAAVVAALPPSRALDYFKSLVPTIQVSPDYANTMATRAFTLAGVTETNILERVKAIIQNRLESGQAFRAAPGDIQRVLDDAGISVRNPQYPEMVFRTNMIQSYNRGSIDAMRDPDVVDLFPVWQYHGIRDGRQRLEHQAHFGRFFPNSVDFETVRDHFYGGDPSPWNCRCTNSAVSKWEWKRLQEKGEKVSELGAYQMPVS